MLTEPAFNALLKTLEEPPAHAIFILATTEIHKVPLTIISRCQRYDFRRISLDTIQTQLDTLAQREGHTAEPEALALLARSSSGSLRDAENLLEQALVSYGSPLRAEQVRDLLELGGDERALDLTRHALKKDTKEGWPSSTRCRRRESTSSSSTGWSWTTSGVPFSSSLPSSPRSASMMKSRSSFGS